MSNGKVCLKDIRVGKIIYRADPIKSKITRYVVQQGVKSWWGRQGVPVLELYEGKLVPIWLANQFFVLDSPIKDTTRFFHKERQAKAWVAKHSPR